MVQMKVATRLLDGRRVGRFTDLITLDNDATIQEALDYGYVVGKKESVKAAVSAVLKAMIDGIARDGNGRKIDGYLSINAFPKRKLADVTDEYTKAIAKVVARARMLKEFKVDTDKWSFVVEGSIGTIEITVITTGEKIGEVVLGEDVHVNGKELKMVEGDTAAWEVPEISRHGNISADKLTSDATRITIDKTALSQLAGDPESDGKVIVFTFTIGGKKAIKSAVLRYVG